MFCIRTVIWLRHDSYPFSKLSTTKKDLVWTINVKYELFFSPIWIHFHRGSPTPLTYSESIHWGISFTWVPLATKNKQLTGQTHSSCSCLSVLLCAHKCPICFVTVQLTSKLMEMSTESICLNTGGTFFLRHLSSTELCSTGCIIYCMTIVQDRW